MNPKDEYGSQVIAWSTTKRWLKENQPDTPMYTAAEKDLPGIEQRLTELRSMLNILPQDDTFMQTAIESLLGGKTTHDFLDVMLNDPFYRNIKFNVLQNCAEYDLDGKVVKWTDADEAASRAYIEKAYGMYQAQKHNDALRLLFKAREYNPVKDLLETVTWDGKPRCEHFLTRWGKTDDTPYTREVSRLIFAGGIWRLYQPGCKFDDVAILIGTKQGEGKSSLIRFLAVRDEWYGEVNQFDGQAAIEQLYGKWICEISELLALTRQKDVEGSKAYITRAVDSYRKPYDRNTTDLPRRCIFLGTTNNATPLRDVYNRRYYPVTLHTVGYDLYDHEQECREYIRQCWAEARERYKRHEMPNYARRELVDVYREEQDNARQDDWREGAIRDYLDSKAPGDYVCIRELTRKALAIDGVGHDPSVVESKDIGMMMSRFDDWKLVGNKRYPEYGVQRSWQKSQFSEIKNDISELPF